MVPLNVSDSRKNRTSTLGDFGTAGDADIYFLRSSNGRKPKIAKLRYTHNLCTDVYELKSKSVLDHTPTLYSRIFK